MPNAKLVPYKVRVKDRSGAHIDLDSFTADHRTFFELLKDFCDKYSNDAFKNAGREKTLRIDNLEITGAHSFGHVKSGEYGISADFFDIDTGDTEQNAREEHHSEEIPLFFHYKSIGNPKADIVIFQKLGRYGAKTVFEEAFKKYLQNQTQRDFELKLNKVVSVDLWQKLQRVERIKEVSLLVHKESADASGDLISDYDPQKRTVTLKAHHGSSLGIAIGELKDQWENREDSYIEIEGVEAEEIHFKTEDEGGGKKTLYLGSDKNPYTESLVLDSDALRWIGGHPTIESIKRESDSYMTELSEKIETDNDDEDEE